MNAAQNKTANTSEISCLQPQNPTSSLSNLRELQPQRRIYGTNRTLKNRIPSPRQVSLSKISDSQIMLNNQLASLRNERDKLIQSNRELENFAAYAAHDLKSPLNTSLGWLGVAQIKASQSNDNQLVDVLLTIEKNLKTAIFHINDVLNIAKLKSPQQHFEYCDLDKLLKSVSGQISDVYFHPSMITIINPLPQVLANPHQIYYVIKNIIDNAVRYRAINRRLKLEIGCTEHESQYEFFFADNGIGIPRTKLAAVFELFEKSPFCTTKQINTGIGLAYCKKIINLHQGHIWAEPNYGAGTVIKFTLQKH